MDKIRFFIALWAAKASIIALKITRHNGTNFPGVVALKICPKFLKYVSKPAKIVGVTGTNGKTTVCNLAIDMFKADGRKVLDNSMGSNINSGISTSFINGVNIFNSLKDNQWVKMLNAIDNEDNIDIDKIYKAILPEAKKHAITFKAPGLGVITLTASDVEKIYANIKEA